MRNRLKEKVLIFLMVMCVAISAVPSLSTFATTAGDAQTSSSGYKENEVLPDCPEEGASDDVVVNAKAADNGLENNGVVTSLNVSALKEHSHDEETEGDISVQGGCTENYCGAFDEFGSYSTASAAAKSSNSATFTQNADGTYTFKWKFTLPKSDAFCYTKANTGNIIATVGVSSNARNAGYACTWNSNNGYVYDGAKYYYLASANVTSGNAGTNTSGQCYPRKYLVWDMIRYEGQNYVHDVHTTLRRTGYKNRNTFTIASDVTVTTKTSREGGYSKTYTGTISKTKYNKLISWCKTAGVAKDASGNYKITVALSNASTMKAGYLYAACQRHDCVWRSYTGAAGNGIDTCSTEITGDIGAKVANVGFNNQTIYKQDIKECRICTWADCTVPASSSNFVSLEDVATSYGSTTPDIVLKDDYDEVEAAAGTVVKPSTHWSPIAPIYGGYVYSSESSHTVVAGQDGTVYRYYTPAPCPPPEGGGGPGVRCIDEFYKGGTRVAAVENATRKAAVHGQPMSGDMWGKTPPAGYEGYTYRDCTSIVCDATTVNNVVYRRFDLGQYKVTYHANAEGVTGAVTPNPGTAYVGDAITLATGGFSRKATNGSDIEWKFVGWSTGYGPNNVKEYDPGQTISPGLGLNENLNLYAVWEPGLKLNWDEGIQKLSIPGLRESAADTTISGRTTYHDYLSLIETLNAVFAENRHLKDVKLNGVPVSTMDLEINGTKVKEWVDKLSKGYPIDALLVDCYDINVLSDSNAGNPVKKVVKSGTTTSVDGSLVCVGDRLDYIITLKNDTAIARDYRIVDTLDEGLTFISATGDYTYEDGVITWNILGAAPQVEQKVVVTVEVNDKKVGKRITNVAETWESFIAELGESAELHESSNRVYNYVLETPEKHLRSSQTSTEVLDDTIVVGGDEAYYTITIRNPLNAPVKYFNVSDMIPKDFIPVEASDNGTISGQKVTWSGISVPASTDSTVGEKTIYVKVKARADMSGEDILNHAELTCTDDFGAQIDSTEVLNYSMKAPEKVIYETLDEDLKPTAETAIVDIDDQVIGDGKLVTYRINWMNPTAGERSIILKDVVPENTRIATSSDLDKATQGISLAQDYDFVNGGTYLITDGGVYDEATREITWTFDSISSLEKKDEGFVEFTVVVLDKAQDTYVRNTAVQTIISPTGINEHNPTAPSNEVKNPVLPTPDKVAVRADGQDVTELVVNDGEEITYEITFKNPAVDSRDFTVTDIVPEFTKLVSSSISDDGVYDADANMITWEMTLAGGETKTVSFAVEVLEEAQNQTVKNTARVYVDRADKKTKEDEPTKIFILEDPTKAVLNLDGEDINNIVKRAGDIITYNIVYKNPADTERVATITDMLPKDVEFISAKHQGSYDVETGTFVETVGKGFNVNYDAQTHTVVWTTPTAAKCQEMVSVDVRILDSARDTTLVNTASVYIPDATKKTNEVFTPVANNPSKSATDSLGQDVHGRLVTLGEEITYEIEFSNPAEIAKEGFVTDTLPVGVDFVSADMQGVYDITTHTVFWKNIQMEARETKTVHVTVKVNEKAASETIKNEAVYRIDEASVSTRLEDGGSGGPESYVATKYVLNSKGEDINKAVVAKDNLLVYKITYKNITQKEQHYTILDVLPEGVEIVNVGDGGFFAVNPLPGLEEYKLPKNRAIAWQFYLQPMEEDYVTVTVRVTDEKVGEVLYNNAVFAVQDPADATQPPFLKETNIVENPVLENPVKMVFNDAGLEITDKMVAVGDEITYKVTFVNPSEETKIADIRDMLPNEVKFVSCDYDGKYDKSLHMVKWSDLEVEGHERITVSCKVKVKESAGGKTIQNQGTVIMDEAAVTTRAKTKDSDPDDPKPSDDPTTDNYVACKKSYNAAGKDITGQVVKVGDTVTYRINFKNTSSDAKKYIVKDILPEEVDFVSATGEYTMEDGVLIWNTELAGGNSGTYDVVVVFNEKALGKTVKNQASITEYDPEKPDDPYEVLPPPADNPVFDEDDFVKKAVDKKGKDISNAFIGVGSNLNYVITLHNPSEDAVEFTVTDALPSEVTFAGCSEGGQYSEEEHTVTWTLTLEGDAKAVLEIATKVKTSVESASIVNKAHLITSSTEMDSNEVYNYVLAAPVKKMFAGLTEIKNGENVEGNTSVTFSISYSNPTDTKRTITIVDKLDADIADRVFSITDDGVLRDGVITWTLEVGAGVSGEVSFIVSSPNVSGAEVVNKATVSLDNEGVTGVTTLDTNKVYYNCVPEDKPTDHPEDGGGDPGREIVKTGDMILQLNKK